MASFGKRKVRMPPSTASWSLLLIATDETLMISGGRVREGRAVAGFVYAGASISKLAPAEETLIHRAVIN
jgi:hypothetical protein